MKKKPIAACVRELLWDMLPTWKQFGSAPLINYLRTAGN